MMLMMTEVDGFGGDPMALGPWPSSFPHHHHHHHRHGPSQSRKEVVAADLAVAREPEPDVAVEPEPDVAVEPAVAVGLAVDAMEVGVAVAEELAVAADQQPEGSCSDVGELALAGAGTQA